MSRRPPWLARWVLRHRLSGSVGDAVSGDLAERFQRDVRSAGPLRARIRYWREVLSPSLSGLRGEAGGLDPTPGASPRSSHREPIMRSLLRDAKYSVRVLAKDPTFTAIAVLSLAVGIGPNTAVFSMVNATLLQGTRAAEPETLIDVCPLGESGDCYYAGHWIRERLQEEADDVLQGVTAWVLMQGAVEEDGLPAPVLYELVTGDYFDVLGLVPARGRFFAPEEDATLGTHPVAVVSLPFWRNRLGADPDVVGSELRVNGRPYTVVGVAPEGWTSKMMPGVQADLWLPYGMYPHLAPDQATNGNLGFTARVRPGVDVETAVAAVEAIGVRIDRERKERGAEGDFVLGAFPWTDFYLHPTLDGPVVAMAGLLMAVVGLVLVIACVNLAGFLLARGTDRRREVAVRLAMGASRASIVRQVLVESALLGLAGGALGLFIGLWTARALLAIELPIELPLNLDVGLDPKVLAFTAGVSVLAGLVFGLTPAFQASRSPVGAVLRDEGNAVAGGRRVGLRGWLVAGQMALCVVLLVGAGLFVRSLAEAASVDPGFDTGPAALVEVSGRGAGYASAAEMRPVVETALEDVRARPEIRSAALVTRPPLQLGNWVRYYDVPGVDPPPNRNDHRIEVTSVSPGYFETMGIALREGRAFTDRDTEDAPPVVIVSRALAEAFWPGESALGRTLVPVSDRENPVTVVGVAENVKIWSLQEPPRPYIYQPFAQAPSTSVQVVVRGAAAPALLGRSVVESLRRVDPGIFVPGVKSMQEHLGFILFLPRMAATLVGGFAVLALLLAVMGLYGIVSYGVARRTREMGIRISLGAAGGDVVGLVVRRGLALALVGAVLGVGVALVASRFIGQWLIGVEPWDPLTMAGVPLVLLAVAAVAAFVPARRASRVNPTEALRAE